MSQLRFPQAKQSWYVVENTQRLIFKNKAGMWFFFYHIPAFAKNKAELEIAKTAKVEELLPTLIAYGCGPNDACEGVRCRALTVPHAMGQANVLQASCNRASLTIGTPARYSRRNSWR
jgi:hypothetical protein